MTYAKTQGKTLKPNGNPRSDGSELISAEIQANIRHDEAQSMTTYNPGLSEEPRNQPLKVVASIAQESLLGWLERTGRLKPHESDDLQDYKMSEDLDDFLEPEMQILDDDEEEPMD